MKKMGLIALAVVVISLIAIQPTLAVYGGGEEEQKICTVRIYSDIIGVYSGNGAAIDPKTHNADEQKPYTDVTSIFYPQGDQSPRKDFITFNPVLISEKTEEDKSELNDLAHKIMVSGQNGREKVFLRMWYAPFYLDKDTDKSKGLSLIIHPGPNGKLETAKRGDDRYSNETYSNETDQWGKMCAKMCPYGKTCICPGPNGVLDSIPGDNDGDGAIEVIDTDDFITVADNINKDEWYPAIVQEYTYMMLDTDLNPVQSDNTASGPDGTGTAMVFPVGIKEELFNDPFGYGLTTLDPKLDGVDKPEVVHVYSEKSLHDILFVKKHNDDIKIDFNGDGDLTPVDPDDTPCTMDGDELVVLTLNVEEGLKPGDKIQFLDHAIEVVAVYTYPEAKVKVKVYYTGDVEPRYIGEALIPAHSVALFGTKNAYDLLKDGEDNLGQLPKGPFFIYVTGINSDEGSAQVIVGRALGATHSAMEEDVNTPDQQSGDPWWLKRFYVDGHEYNVIAICGGNDTFKFITIQTPIPKITGEQIDVLIEQHSVRLQEYGPNVPLSVMPPYNYEHTEVADIVDEVCVSCEVCPPCPPETECKLNPCDDVMGELYVAKPIYHTTGTYKTLDGRTLEITLKDLMFYVDEGVEPELKGELKELFKSKQGKSTEEYWYVMQYWSKPWMYTQFYLPVGHGKYLITLNYTDEFLVGRFNCSFFNDSRVKFWYDPEDCGKKYKNETGVRIYSDYPLNINETWKPVCKYDKDNDICIPGYNGTPPTVGNLSACNNCVDAPYTDELSIFNPLGKEAWTFDIMTFDPAYMDEFRSHDELNDLGLYSQISIEGNDAREKVFMRMWYEPVHKDIEGVTYSALMQEYTYMLVGTNDLPAHGTAGNVTFAFPIGTEGWQLDDAVNGSAPICGGGYADTNTTDGDSIWGYGLTTFDPLPYDGVEEAYAVTVHSEKSLNDIIGQGLDFNGDGQLTGFDPDNQPFSGDELVIFTVTLNLKTGDKFQFIDYMGEVADISYDQIQGTASVKLNIYKLGDISGKPVEIESSQSVDVGKSLVVNKVWFVYVDSINSQTGQVALIVGRALGNASANEDPSVDQNASLKRFYVDGHEYSVVAIGIYDDKFKFITIRTPVQKEESTLDEVSFRCQQYCSCDDGFILYVMPPFNYEHTARLDVQEDWLPVPVLRDALNYEGGIEKHKLPLEMCWVDEGMEPQFIGKIKEILNESRDVENNTVDEFWVNEIFITVPNKYTDIKIIQPDEKYLITTSWTLQQGIIQFVNFDNDDDVINMSTAMSIANAELRNRVQFWYDPDDTTDLYVNEITIGKATITGEVWDVAHTYPIYNAEVTLSGAANMSTTTDIAGKYTFSDLDPGDYTITVTKDGYETESVDITILGAGTYTVNFEYNYGLIPSEPDLNYVLKVIQLWYNGQIDMSKLLEVISVWSRTL